MDDSLSPMVGLDASRPVRLDEACVAPPERDGSGQAMGLSKATRFACSVHTGLLQAISSVVNLDTAKPRP